MNHTQNSKRIFIFGDRTWVFVKGIACIVLIYFAIRLIIGAGTDGSVSAEGPYILCGVAIAFIVGAVIGIIRFIQDIRKLKKAKAIR